MGVDWDTVTRFVPEVTLAVIFGLFVLKLLERQDKRDAERDAGFIHALEKRDAEWRGYMAEDRDRHGAGLGRVADEVKNVASLVAATNALVAQHDQWARLEASRAKQVQ
jgi:hypothetical protein